MKNWQSVLATVVLVCAQGQNHAHAKTQWQLRDLLEAATRSSPVLSQAYLSIGSAEGDYKVAESTLAWQLEASLAASRETLLLDDRSSAANDSLLGSVAVSKALSTGGRIQVDANAEELTGVALDPLGQRVARGESRVSAGVSMTQPLSRFRGRSVETTRVSQARLGQTIADIQLQVAARDEIARIADAYRRLAVAESVLSIREESLKLADSQLEIALAAVRSGVAADSERSAVEQARYRRQAAIIDSELQVLSVSLEIRQLVGLDVLPDDVELRSMGMDKPSLPKENLQQTLRVVARSNPLLRIAQLATSVEQQDLQLAKQEARPKVDLLVAARSLGSRDANTGALAAAAGLQSYQVSAGLNLQWDISAKLGTGRVLAARARHQQLEISLRIEERAQAAQAVQAWTEVRAFAKQLALSDKAVELAKDNVLLETRRFKAGDVSSFDVLLRQDELALARIAALDSQLRLLRASDALLAVRGELLDHYGLTLDRELAE